MLTNHSPRIAASALLALLTTVHTQMETLAFTLVTDAAKATAQRQYQDATAYAGAAMSLLNEIDVEGIDSSKVSLALSYLASSHPDRARLELLDALSGPVAGICSRCGLRPINDPDSSTESRSADLCSVCYSLEIG